MNALHPAAPRVLRVLPFVLLSACLGVSSLAAAEQPAPPPGPAPQPGSKEPGGNHSGELTVKIIGMDAAGEVGEEGQKTLNQMLDDGWRPAGMSTVSATPPITVAVMFMRPPRRPMMPQRGFSPPGGLPPGAGPGPGPGAPPAGAPGPGPVPAH
jgi:hypothetical protein